MDKIKIYLQSVRYIVLFPIYLTHCAISGMILGYRYMNEDGIPYEEADRMTDRLMKFYFGLD